MGVLACDQPWPSAVQQQGANCAAEAVVCPADRTNHAKSIPTAPLPSFLSAYQQRVAVRAASEVRCFLLHELRLP